MWKDSPHMERVKCLISTAVVMAYFGLIYFYFCNSDLAVMAYYYLAPLSVFGWWLVTVTYLQHHEDDTLVYDDETWKFVDAAFETVDRDYGTMVDSLSHHITNGHVVHHLFFTKIPHYHLEEATACLQKYLSENGLMHLYKHKSTKDFFLRVHMYFYNFGFNVKKAVNTKKEQ
jgi:omega-3 fatty acid desaturase (delta-15 desaturase)